MVFSHTVRFAKLSQSFWKRMVTINNSNRALPSKCIPSNLVNSRHDSDILGAISKLSFSSAATSSSGGTYTSEDRDRLERKLSQVTLIQEHVEGLQANWEKGKDTFSNVQWETSAEIEALFEDSKSKKKEIRDSLEELQNLMKEARVVLELALQKDDAESAKQRLERLATKIEHCEAIEANLAELENIYHRQREHYHNVGMRTAAEIDLLFKDSKMKKDKIENSVSELKKVIEGTLEEM